MSVVLPMVAMVFFCVLFVSTYAWMCRPEFGESKGPTMKVTSRPTGALTPEDEHRGAEHSLSNLPASSGSTQDQSEVLKGVGL